MNDLQNMVQEKSVLRWGGLAGILGGIIFIVVFVIVGFPWGWNLWNPRGGYEVSRRSERRA